MARKRIFRYAVREALGLVVMAAALFGSAGTIRWWPAWAALGVMAAWIAATAYVVVRVHPGLLAERLGPRPGAKRWDAAILSALGLAQLARYVIAGLDRRHGWTGGVSTAAQVAALGLCIVGYALVVWATAANPFFSQVVRIQSERGHTVIRGGPYRFVRHPAYGGAILYEAAVSVLLASWWSLAAGGLGVLLLVLRTALEDRTLRDELAGYDDYARAVRFRLLPGVW